MHMPERYMWCSRLLSFNTPIRHWIKLFHAKFPKASMDADHSGTVTEAEARKALKNRMPPVTSAAGNGEKISMTSGDPGSESDVFFYRGWSWQVGPNSDGLGGPKKPTCFVGEWHDWWLVRKKGVEVVAPFFLAHEVTLASDLSHPNWRWYRMCNLQSLHGWDDCSQEGRGMVLGSSPKCIL